MCWLLRDTTKFLVLIIMIASQRLQKVVTIRLFLALASAMSWSRQQLDINNAFLHGFLNEDGFMVPPEGYIRARPSEVCHLKRSLYGLNQASRQWNCELTSHLCFLGFIQSNHDHCLFIRSHRSSFLALLGYVDDILLIGFCESALTSVRASLHSRFTIKALPIPIFTRHQSKLYLFDTLIPT